MNQESPYWLLSQLVEKATDRQEEKEQVVMVMFVTACSFILVGTGFVLFSGMWSVLLD